MEFKRAQQKFIFLSLLLHCIFLATVFLTMDFSKTERRVGNASIDYVAAFLSQEKKVMQEMKTMVETNQKNSQAPSKGLAQKTREDLFTRSPAPILIPKKSPPQREKKRIAKVDMKIKIKKTAKNPSMQKTGGQRQGAQLDQLTMLLHDAIQKQQQYPLAAMMMERKGRVTVAFTLTLQGEIKNLSVAKSSGTTSLDQAAMRAVQDAVPFPTVQTYISEPQDFKIDVVFD